jgi:HEPN domain-containing protein
MKPTTLEWVEKAENDFTAASQLMRRRKSVMTDAACFFCQQSVEKYFKARLIEAGIAFPRTHDLRQLLNLCLVVEPLWSDYETRAETLTDYAVSFRYPGESATLAEAKRALKDCQALRAEVRRSLGLSV